MAGMTGKRGGAWLGRLTLLSGFARVRSEWISDTTASLRVAFAPAGSPWSCVSPRAIAASMTMGGPVGTCSIIVGDPCDGQQDGADGWGSVVAFHAQADGSLPAPSVLTGPPGVRAFGMRVHDVGKFGPYAGQQLLVCSRDVLFYYAASTRNSTLVLRSQRNQTVTQVVNLGNIDDGLTVMDDIGIVEMGDDGSVTASIALGNRLGTIDPIPIDTSRLAQLASKDTPLAWVALGVGAGDVRCRWGSGVGFMLAAPCNTGGRGGAPSAYAFGLCDARPLNQSRPVALTPRQAWSSPDGGAMCVERAWKAVFNTIYNTADPWPWKFDVLIATKAQLWTVDQSEFHLASDTDKQLGMEELGLHVQLNGTQNKTPAGTVASGNGAFGSCDMSTAVDVGSIDGDVFDDVWIFCSGTGAAPPFGVVLFGGGNSSAMSSRGTLDDFAVAGRVMRVSLPPAMTRYGYTLAPPYAQKPVAAGGCSFDRDAYPDVAVLAWHNETGDRVLVVVFGAPRWQLLGILPSHTPSPTSSQSQWRSHSSTPTWGASLPTQTSTLARSAGVRRQIAHHARLAAVVLAACVFAAHAAVT
jgi:hypothetical protein